MSMCYAHAPPKPFGLRVMHRYDALPFAGELIDELRATLRALPSVDATTRDFRVYLKSLTQTAIEIEIEIHFRGNSGTEFRYKRQNALLAIAQIVEKRGAKVGFAPDNAQAVAHARAQHASHHNLSTAHVHAHAPMCMYLALIYVRCVRLLGCGGSA